MTKSSHFFLTNPRLPNPTNQPTPTLTMATTLSERQPPALPTRDYIHISSDHDGSSSDSEAESPPTPQVPVGKRPRSDVDGTDGGGAPAAAKRPRPAPGGTSVSAPGHFAHPEHDKPKRDMTHEDRTNLKGVCFRRAFAKADADQPAHTPWFVCNAPLMGETNVGQKYLITPEFADFFQSTPQGKLWATAFGPSLWETLSGKESFIFEELQCPITMEPLAGSDPVLAADGHLYSEDAIRQVIENADRDFEVPRSPMTNQELPHTRLVNAGAVGRAADRLHCVHVNRARRLFAELVSDAFDQFYGKACDAEAARAAQDYDERLAAFEEEIAAQHRYLEQMLPVPPNPQALYNPFGGASCFHPDRPAASLVNAVRSGWHLPESDHEDGPWKVPAIGPLASVINQVHGRRFPGVESYAVHRFMSKAHRDRWAAFRRQLMDLREQMITTRRWVKK